MNPLLAALIQAGLLSQEDADRLNRQLDPDVARIYGEGQLTNAFHRGLFAQQGRILALINDTQGRPTERQLNGLWQGEDARLWASVEDEILRLASEYGVTATISTGSDLWQLVNEQVVDYAENYYTSTAAANVGSIPNLNQTSRGIVGRLVADWQRGVLPQSNVQDGLPQLIRELEMIFGTTRATTIGVTETTRIFSMAEVAAARANEFITSLMWETSLDEQVCPICGPRHGVVIGKESDGFRVETDDTVGYPPAHVRCRCRLTSLTQPTLEALRAEELVNA